MPDTRIEKRLLADRETRISLCLVFSYLTKRSKSPFSVRDAHNVPKLGTSYKIKIINT